MTAGGGTGEGWPTLLVVDEDPDMLRMLVCYFEKRGFHVAAASSVHEAKSFFSRCKRWTMVISDYHLPDGNGRELCTWVRDQPGTPPPVLLMSGSAQAATLCAGVEYLAKPFPVQELEHRLHRMLTLPPTDDRPGESTGPKGGR